MRLNNMDTISEIVKGQVSTGPWLSFKKRDIEKMLLFPAGKFTSAGFMLPFLMTLVLTVLFFALLSVLPSSRFVIMFVERGVIPYVIAIFTFWSLSIIFVKFMKLRVQKEALNITVIPTDDPDFNITRSSAPDVLDNLYKEVYDPKEFLLTRRIQMALSNLKNIGNVSDVDKILSTQAENDEANCDSSYTPLRGFIWAIPVLGFIGTVLGLSLALGSFGAVLSGATEMASLKIALQEVTRGLSTAFETTLEGLVAALTVHLLMTALQRKEEQFLDDCKDYCHINIVFRLKLEE